MPRAQTTHYPMPGILEATENHRAILHEQLSSLIRQHLTICLKIPQGTKMRKTDSDSIGTFSGSARFRDLESWLTDLVIMLEAEQYGGPDRDRECCLQLLSFLSGEAKKWYHQHTVSINRRQLSWTFEEIILGLYDRFIHPSTMQDAHKAFFVAKYTSDKGVQGFYDTLLDHAHNMAVYPDDYLIVETFLKGIPESLREPIITDGLLPEVNTIDDFAAQAKRYEYSKKTLDHYNRMITGRVSTDTREAPSPSTKKNRTSSTNCPDHKNEPRPRQSAMGETAHHMLMKEDHPTGNRPKPMGEVSFHVQVDNERTRATVDIICYNCGEKGHKSRDCKRPCKPKVHLWAAHTEIPCHSDAGRDMRTEDDEVHPKDTERDEGGESNEEIIEVEVPEDLYSNDFYERESSSDYMAPMHIGTMESNLWKHHPPMESNLWKHHPPMGEPIHDEHPIRMRKVTMRAEKAARERLTYTPAEKQCLATYVDVGGCKAWMLWDSGSTTTGVTPSFAHGTDLTVFPLSNPHTLQLGTIGSRSTVNYGTESQVKAPGVEKITYLDIANFDHYDMIIGTPFMRQNKVQLDLETNQVIINGVATPATPVDKRDIDEHICRYRSTDKHKG
jgi:hypothetical protein